MTVPPSRVPEWLPGALWRPIPGCPGLPWDTDQPERFAVVGHSTESDTGSMPGVIATYTANRSAPHLTVDPYTEEIAQHVSLRLAAYSLRNGPHEVETNRDPFVWQVEIIGRAATMDDLPTDRVVWLAEAVFGPLCSITGTPAVAEPTHHYPPEDGHRLGREPWRFSIARWDTFSGICWHQNVPDSNTHGDPGALDWVTFQAHLTPEDDDMTDDDRKRLASIESKLDRIIASEQTNTARVLEIVRGVRKLLART